MIKDPMIQIRNNRFKSIRNKLCTALEMIDSDKLCGHEIDEVYCLADNLIETSQIDGMITSKHANELYEWLGKIEQYTN